MREKKYHIYLTDDEQSRVIQSLINLKNNLIALLRYFRYSREQIFPSCSALGYEGRIH